MPDFTFYINDVDRDSILRVLLEGTHLKITPNINHLTPFPESFGSVSPELVSCLDMNPSCYISGPFSKCAVQTVEMEKGTYAGTYVVAENKGGPILKLSLVTQRIDGGCKRLVPSHLTYAAKFWNEKSTQLISASEELKASFKFVRGLLVSRCKKLKTPSVCIGRSAFEDFESGEMSLLVNGVLLGGKRPLNVTD